MSLWRSFNHPGSEGLAFALLGVGVLLSAGLGLRLRRLGAAAILGLLIGGLTGYLSLVVGGAGLGAEFALVICAAGGAICGVVGALGPAALAGAAMGTVISILPDVFLARKPHPDAFILHGAVGAGIGGLLGGAGALLLRRLSRTTRTNCDRSLDPGSG